MSINANVVDKDGEAVPMDQRGMAGQYKFAIAPFELTATDPEVTASDMTDDKPEVVPEAPITLQFNSVVDPASITTAELHLFKGVGADCTGGTEVPSASVRIFQILDDAPPDGVVADDTTIQIADASATGFIADPTDPTLDGVFFDEMETYRLEFTAGAQATDAAGGVGDLALPMDTVLCFDTDMAAP
ncbi:MAG: Ig-like domain-containing protein [Vicinamibacterales bacterium]